MFSLVATACLSMNKIVEQAKPVVEGITYKLFVLH